MKYVYSIGTICILSLYIYIKTCFRIFKHWHIIKDMQANYSPNGNISKIFLVNGEEIRQNYE